MQHPPELQQLFCCVLPHTFCHVQVKLNKFFKMQNTTCPNILWCLYLFCALFVLYLEQLYTKQDIYILAVLFLQPLCSLALSPWHHWKTFLSRQAQVLGLQWKLLLKQNYKTCWNGREKLNLMQSPLQTKGLKGAILVLLYIFLRTHSSEHEKVTPFGIISC